MRLSRLFTTSLLAVATVFAHAQAPAASAGNVNVGQSSGPVMVTVTMTANGTGGTAQAVTQGVAGMDFALAPGGNCGAGPYTVGSTCTAYVTFSPKYPGFRNGAVTIPNSGGGTLGTGYVNGVGVGGLGVLLPGEVNTVAGSGSWIYKNDGVAATSAEIFLPMGVVMDSAGNMYISDSNNNRVRRVDAVTNLISTVAGTGIPGYSGDGGAATAAQISAPSGIMLDGAGNIFFVDSGNHIVRRIDAVTGIITTVAGTPATQGYTGDGGAATAAKLSLPEGLAFDAAGNMYIADTGNSAVREVAAATGFISTVAGTGTSGYNGDNRPANTAMLNEPWGVTAKADGTLLISDLSNNRVRQVSLSGTITTIAGTGVQGFSGDGSSATSANINAPAATVVDPAGDIFIADSGNNRVRKIYANTGNISTLTGSNSEQFAGDGGPANMASFYGPYALYFGQKGDLLIADMFHNRVREIYAQQISLQYATIRVGKTSAPQTEGLENDGNANLTINAATFSNAALDPATTTCTTSSLVSSSTSCNYGVEFAPTTVGTNIQGYVHANSDAANSPAVITVSGDVLDVNPTAVSLTSSENPSLVGDLVTFTATVTSDVAGQTGTVTFLDGTTTICNAVPLNNNGIATCAVSTLALGQHNMTANYSGDAQNASAVSAVLVQTVLQNVTLTLTASPNPANVGQTVTMTLQATAATGIPAGNITFYDGATALGAATLDGTGKATYATSSLAPGAHSLVAKYSGDNKDAPGTSNIVSEQINQTTTTVTLATSNGNVPVGTSVTFTATVSGANGTPTGIVTFMDGATALGQGAVNASGVATCTTSALTPGAHSIVAKYGGDTNNGASSSAALTETVTQLGTTTTLSSDTNPANAGSTIHLTAVVAIASGFTADGTITGTVTFYDGATVLGSGNVDATGTATLAVSTLVVGSHALTAVYSGNTNYATSTSVAVSEVIQSTGTTIALSSSNLNALAGKPVTFTATVASSTGTPTGTVTFRDGATTLGAGTLNGAGVATYTTSSLSVGSHNITAVYNGDANYNSATSTTVVETISLATANLALSGPTTPVDAGLQVTLTTTLTSNNGVAPTGALTLKDGATVIGSQNVTNVGTFTFNTSTLSIGTHTLTATYAGDADNAPATSNSISVVIQQATSSTTLVSNLNPAVVGQSVTFTATVTTSSPNAGGSVSFMDGATSLGSVPLGSNGTAAFSTSSLAFGQHTITAVYSGDTNHGGSTSPVLNEQIVQQGAASVSSTPNPSVSGNNVVFTVKINGVGSLVPTGKVTLTDGGATLTVLTLDATGTATYATTTLAVGSHSITASYAGDTNYAPATASEIQTVGNADTQVALTVDKNPATYGAPVTLTATITSNGGVATGNVTFTDGGKSIGTAVLNASGVATLTTTSLQPGSHTIVANYSGDGKAGASASAPLTLIVKEAASVTLTSSNNPEYTLNSVTFTATVINAGVGVPTGTVTFTDGTTNLGTVTLNGAGVATVTVPSMVAGAHPIVASYTGDGNNFAAVSGTLNQTIQLRPTTTSLSFTATDPTNPLSVTLIAVVHWNGTQTTIPTGNVTFTAGTTTIGSAPMDATGVATLTITLTSSTETVVAAYNGDTNYAASQSLATSISGGAATQFTMTMNPTSVSLQSKQRTTVTITVNSVKNFTDKMQFGCLGLPYAATCTFSQTGATLAANGTLTVQLTLDTGNPLGSGASTTASNTGGMLSGHTAPLLALLPVGLLSGLMMFRRRKGSRKVPALLLLLFGLAVTMGMTGCSGLTTNGTPAGSYVIKVTASGQGTGATQSLAMNMTVTQ